MGGGAATLQRCGGDDIYGGTGAQLLGGLAHL